MSNKVIIVTGASRGIGQAICNCLLKESQTCNILATARSQEALASLEKDGQGRVATLVGDMCDHTLGHRAVESAIQKWGRVDGLIINHGVVDPVQPIRAADVDAWRKSFDINVFGVLELLKAALEPLRSSQGTIVLTSSGAAVKGTATWGAYSAGKAVLNSLARTIAAEEPNISVVPIRPGVVATEMQDTLRDQHFSKMQQADVDRFGSMREKGEMLRPDQPGNVIARLALHSPRKLEVAGGEMLNWDDERLHHFQDR